MSVPAADIRSILVIRLGAMGDIIHALPAVASLKLSFPKSKLSWLIARRWLPLLEGNPYVDERIVFDRSGLAGLRSTWRTLRRLHPTMAMDFQGLFQSALAGKVAGAIEFFGFDKTVAREPLASKFYSHPVSVRGPHRIERNLQLAEAAGASSITDEAWIPKGERDGRSSAGPFVLASPFAGWRSKQWPLEYYDVLGQGLKAEGLELVVNVSSDEQRLAVSHLKHVRVGRSSIAGLLAATHAATAVVGVDSGPLHLAAALRKPGVAIFGPTDPTQTGPYGGTIAVLRDESARTTYKRDRHTDDSMRKISPEQVKEALMRSLALSSGSRAKQGSPAGGIGR